MSEYRGWVFGRFEWNHASTISKSIKDQKFCIWYYGSTIHFHTLKFHLTLSTKTTVQLQYPITAIWPPFSELLVQSLIFDVLFLQGCNQPGCWNLSLFWAPSCLIFQQSISTLLRVKRQLLVLWCISLCEKVFCFCFCCVFSCKWKVKKLFIASMFFKSDQIFIFKIFFCGTVVVNVEAQLSEVVSTCFFLNCTLALFRSYQIHSVTEIKIKPKIWTRKKTYKFDGKFPPPESWTGDAMVQVFKRFAGSWWRLRQWRWR